MPPNPQPTPVTVPSPMKKKGLVEQLLDAPRKLKERAEEYGAETEKKYHDTREVPAQKKAEEVYNDRQQENEQKLKSGAISQPLYQSRQQKYQQEREKMSKPVEQRISGGLVDIGKNLQRGLVGPTTKQKAETEYETGMKVADAKYKAGTTTAKEYGDTLVGLETKRRNAEIDFSMGLRKNKFEGGGLLHEIQFGKAPTPHKAGRGIKFPSQKSAQRSHYDMGINFNSPLFGRNKKPRK